MKTQRRSPKAAKKAAIKRKAKPALLAGGNPQIARAGGAAPVQAYIDAMPGWKRDIGRRLDALIRVPVNIFIAGGTELGSRRSIRPE